jgi:drug/metabolite transporter (DMT)-like permease
LSWALATVASKYALGGFSALDLLVLEIAVGTLALWGGLAARRRVGRGFRGGYLLLGLLEPGLAYALFNLGLERTSAANGALLVSLESLAIAVLGIVFLRERLSWPLTAALTLSVGGAALLTGQETPGGASLTGDWLVLAAVVAAASYAVAARRMAPGADVVVVTAYQLLGALLVAVPIWATGWLWGGSSTPRRPTGWPRLRPASSVRRSPFSSTRLRSPAYRPLGPRRS